MKQPLLLITLVYGLIALPTQAATSLLVDSDFSVNPGSGSPAPVAYNAPDPGTYQYVLSAAAGSTVTNVGGTGGWTFYNGGGKGLSAVNLEDTLTTNNMTWVPDAAASNTNGYVIQLDTIAHSSDINSGVTIGNAIAQTFTVSAGQAYSLTFSINTEAGAAKAALSGVDVMVTDATITNSTGSSGTVLTSSTTNRNALTYGNVTGVQYTVDTRSSPTGGTASTWQTYTLTFTANSSGSSTLTFADDIMDIANNSNIALENITLVPEPREWAMIVLLGLMGVAIARKFQGRKLLLIQDRNYIFPT